jgi:AraC-like DNA-binding protein
MEFENLTGGFYLPMERRIDAERAAKQRHRFATVRFSQSFLHNRLASCDGALNPVVERFIRGERTAVYFGGTHRLTVAQEHRVADLLNPPALLGARPIWYEAKVLELMAEFFFDRQCDDELFCDRQKRLARERVDRVVAILSGRLSERLNLKQLGREAGCSPFYLSRTFTSVMGMTISQYQRKLRMERAAELLRSGNCNVTEAALAVGYSSLSYFSQAFCETMGCCPGLYPLKTTTQQARSNGPRA